MTHSMQVTGWRWPAALALVVIPLALADNAAGWDSQRFAGEDNAERRTSVTPHFVLDEEKQEALRKGVETLAIGDTRTKAIEVLGPPSREELVAPKQASTWVHRYLIYDVKIIDKLPGNVNDKRVELIFDRQDKLVEVFSNVQGIPSR